MVNLLLRSLSQRRGLWLAVMLGSGLAEATAQEVPAQRRVSVYVEAGHARHNGAATQAMALGIRWPTEVSFLDGRLHLYLDGYASHWDADAAPGARRDFVQVGLVPMWRWRSDGGRSPWFVEAGIGVSYLFHGYATRTKGFGSRWNFSDHLGLGRSFGSRREHELGRFLKHVSNAGLSRPNPGETFYQLRYGYAF